MLCPIDTTEDTPRHQQVYDRLLTSIRAGYWSIGEKIPAELELAAELGVAKLTIHRAVQALAKDGWVTRSVGRGTFVAPPPVPSSLQRVVLAFGASATNILGSDYYGSLYRGIVETLGKEVEVLLCPDSFGTHPLPPCDGILVIAPREEARAGLANLARQKPPALVVGAHWPNLSLPCIDSDNEAAARHAVSFLAEQGHTHLVLVFTEPETSNMRDRIAGFRAESRARHLTIEQQPAQSSWQLSPEEKKTLLGSLQQGSTAIFAAGYYLALDVLNALREADYSVPKDISVIGFDDPISAQLVYPPLTTLRQPLYEMGRRAALRLQDLASGTPLEGSVELLPVELIVRSSTQRR